jgi:Zn-dependent peptidase ImmA (M78 family)
MAFQRGFKTEAKNLADEVRSELDLGTYDALDPRVLAEHLLIPIWSLSESIDEHPAIGHLLTQEPELFSALTVFAGTRRTIVHNDSHTRARQNSNLAHELSHGLLGHPPTPALDNTGCREWRQDIEDEASWLAGVLLVSEPSALAIAKGRWTKTEAALRFGVSPQMIQFRLNATGAIRRVQRSKHRM